MEAKEQRSYQYRIAQKRVKKIKDFYVHLLVYLFVNAAIIIVSSRDEGLLNGLLDIKNYITAVLWGIGIFFHWWSVFGPDVFFGKQWEEKKIKEIMEKEKQRSWE